MKSPNLFRLGGKLLAAGATFALLLITSILVLSMVLKSSIPMDYMIVSSLFGHWFAVLVVPPTTEGVAFEFYWTQLLWLPWAGVFLIFLLSMAVRVLRKQFKSDLVLLSILGVLGSLFLVALLYQTISIGFDYSEFELVGLLHQLLTNVATICMIIGIGLILFNYKEVISGYEINKFEDQLDEQQIDTTENNNVSEINEKSINKNKIAIWVGFIFGTLWSILSLASKGKIPGGAQGGAVGFFIGYILTRLILAFIPSQPSSSYSERMQRRKKINQDQMTLERTHEKEWLCQNCKKQFMVPLADHKRFVESKEKVFPSCPHCGGNYSMAKDVILGK